MKDALYNSSFLCTHVDLDFMWNLSRFLPEKATTLAADILNELVQVSAYITDTTTIAENILSSYLFNLFL